MDVNEWKQRYLRTNGNWWSFRK